MDGFDFDDLDRDNSPAAAVTRSTLDSLIQVGETHTGNIESKFKYLVSMQAITNEKHSPEILPYRGDLVDELQQQIEKQVGHRTA